MDEPIRIQTVPGGYKRDNQTGLIHANELVPFSSSKKLDERISSNIPEMKDKNYFLGEHRQKLKNSSKIYARDMKADFFEVEFNQEISGNHLNSTARVQLYVWNKNSKLNPLHLL